MDTLWAEFAAQTGGPADEVPPGFLTIHQYAERFKVNVKTAGERLRQAAAEGKMEARYFRTSVPHRGACLIRFYRPIAPKK